jgi:hypothetical protein
MADFVRISPSDTVGDHLTRGPTLPPDSLTDVQNDRISTTHDYTNMTSIIAASEANELLEPGKWFNYTFFAKSCGFSRSTLLRRHRGVQSSRDPQYEE